MPTDMNFRSTAKGTPRYVDGEVLEAGTVARLVSANGGIEAYLPDCRAVLMVLETTDLDSLTGDELNVFIQTFVGGAWLDVCHFTQLLGDDADDEQIHIAKLTADLAAAMVEDIDVLAATNIRNFIGTKWRCRWEITDGGGAHSFTFSVKIQPM